MGEALQPMTTMEIIEQAILDIERLSPPAEPKFQRETVRAIVKSAINRALQNADKDRKARDEVAHRMGYELGLRDAANCQPRSGMIVTML